MVFNIFASLNQRKEQIVLKMKSILTTLLLFLSWLSFAQDEIVVIKVSLNDESGKPLAGVILNSYIEDSLFSSHITKANGVVDSLKLPLGTNYRIIIGKQGYVSKIASLDTRFYSVSNLQTTTPIHMRMDITLFEECYAGNYEFMKTEPLINFKLDSTMFLQYDRKHLIMMKKKVEDAKYANLSAEDKEAFSAVYDEGIEQMELENFDASLDLLLKAKEIVDCPFVVDKIQACEIALNLQEEYQLYLADGDRLFAENKFDAATSAYQKACIILPNEQYPKEQLAEIEYQIVLQKANEYFNNKDYEKALELYNRALILKPSATTFNDNRATCQKEITLKQVEK